MLIQYYIKNVYGNDNMYIKDEKTNKAVSTLTKKKTIDHRDIRALTSLGFQVEQVYK